MLQRTTIVWRIHDDKPGHRNQLRGLSNALAELLPLEVCWLRAPSRRSSLAALWAKQCELGRGLPAPDLIVGAGHSTHLAVLAARKAYGGQAVVLMKPSLPTRLFDLCIVPEHDQLPESERVLVTRGVLNMVRPSRAQEDRSGLLLIGGPSAAHGWSEDRMLAQIISIVTSTPSIRWQLSDSRRTPANFLERLAALNLSNLQQNSHQETTSDWVPQQLDKASQVWVSEDSVSMVYEALTSGASVGVLEVPSKRAGRVSAGMQTLLREGWATRFEDWQPGTRLDLPPKQLDEARRCARIVCQRLLSSAAA